MLSSAELRGRNANVKLATDHVVIAPGSILVNDPGFSALFGAGDHIIRQYPTYASLQELPRCISARGEGLLRVPRFPRIDSLGNLVKLDTTAIII